MCDTQRRCSRQPERYGRAASLKSICCSLPRFSIAFSSSSFSSLFRCSTHLHVDSFVRQFLCIPNEQVLPSLLKFVSGVFGVCVAFHKLFHLCPKNQDGCCCRWLSCDHRIQYCHDEKHGIPGMIQVLNIRFASHYLLCVLRTTRRYAYCHLLQ